MNQFILAPETQPLDLQVSQLFKDASIGNHITIKVVDIENLADKSFYSSSDMYWRSKYNVNNVWATEMLKKFCGWQFDNRHLRDRTRHYDTALLLTRYKNKKFDLLELKKYKCLNS